MEQTQEQPKLEDMLLGIASLTDISKDVGKARTPQEQADIYRSTAQLISNGDEANYQRIIKEFTRNPAYAVLQMEGKRDNLAGSIKEQYDKEKNRITKNVESRINETLKGAENKAQASMILAQYLRNILEVPEYTQEQVDESERQSVYNMGFPYAFEARGSTEHYKNLQLRLKASEYLKETKKGDTIRYAIDSKKLNKAMENVVTGASLYKRFIEIEEQTKKLKEAIEKAKQQQTQEE